MSTEVFLALVVYAFVTSVTPGPNNFMLLASGVNFGFFRTIPHILGISAGFAALLFSVGLGLGALLGPKALTVRQIQQRIASRYPQAEPVPGPPPLFVER